MMLPNISRRGILNRNLQDGERQHRVSVRYSKLIIHRGMCPHRQTEELLGRDRCVGSNHTRIALVTFIGLVSRPPLSTAHTCSCTQRWQVLATRDACIHAGALARGMCPHRQTEVLPWLGQVRGEQSHTDSIGSIHKTSLSLSLSLARTYLCY